MKNLISYLHDNLLNVLLIVLVFGTIANLFFINPNTPTAPQVGTITIRLIIGFVIWIVIGICENYVKAFLRSVAHYTNELIHNGLFWGFIVLVIVIIAELSFGITYASYGVTVGVVMYTISIFAICLCIVECKGDTIKEYFKSRRSINN